jgi:hypothetical protein
MTAVAVASEGTFHEILIALALSEFNLKQQIIPSHLTLTIIRRFSAAMFSLVDAERCIFIGAILR